MYKVFVFLLPFFKGDDSCDFLFDYLDESGVNSYKEKFANKVLKEQIVFYKS